MRTGQYRTDRSTSRSDIIAFIIFTLGIIFYMPPRKKGPMVAVIVCLVAQGWKLGVAVGVALLLLCSAKLAVVLCMLSSSTPADDICKASNDRLDYTMANCTYTYFILATYICVFPCRLKVASRKLHRRPNGPYDAKRY